MVIPMSMCQRSQAFHELGCHGTFVSTWKFLCAATKMPQIWVLFSAAIFGGKSPGRLFIRKARNNLHRSDNCKAAAAKICPTPSNAYGFMHNMYVTQIEAY